MSELTPRERVMAYLRREIPDRVPWVEQAVDAAIQVQIMGRGDWEPGDLCQKLGMDGFGGAVPGRGAGLVGRAVPRANALDHYYYPSALTFDFVPPWIAEMGTSEPTGRRFVKKGLLTSRDALALFDEFLPDPDHPARYEQAAEGLKKYRGDYAVFARIRLGTASTLESMGLDVFSYMLYDDPDLIHEVHRRFADWTTRVLRHLNELDFDFYWVADDVAANNGPFISPKAFRQFLLPHMAAVAREIKKPWIFHSDGDFLPVLPDLLTLGMSAVHPVQPSVMDIAQVKREFGERVALAGNIDLDYTLTRGTPEEVEAEVKERIRSVAPGGGYMVTSANSITSYCRAENVLAMARAIRRYGKYPIDVARAE